MGKRFLGILCLLISGEVSDLAGECRPASDGLVGWWPCDSGATDIAGGNGGTLVGSVTAGNPGIVGSCFSFDGTSAYIRIADAPALKPAALTVEAWVQFRSLDSPGTAAVGQQYIVFKQNSRSQSFEGFELGKDRISGRDLFVFRVTSAAGVTAEVFSASNVVAGTWYHVAGLRGPDYVQLYVNGVLQGQAPATFSQSFGTLPLYFGSSGQAYWDRKFAGYLDEVSMYNRALTAEEIRAVYNAGAAGKCKDVIITGSPSSLNVAPGETAAFQATATGYGQLSYQWRFDAKSLSGATTSLLTLTNVQPTQAGEYDVIVANTFSSATSGIAVLNVSAPPKIISQAASRTNLVLTPAVFQVVATGTEPLHYQWRFNGSSIAGATASTYSLPAVTTADAGSYNVSVSNVAGVVTSGVAILVVHVPPVIAAHPQPQAVNPGRDANFQVVAEGTAPLRYQWFFNGSAIEGATTSSYTRPNVQPEHSGNYSVVVTNVAGSATSSIAALSVNRPPNITDQPVGATVDQGQAATFRVIAEGTLPLAYRWRFNGGFIAGATDSAYTRSNAQVEDAGSYDVVVTNIAGSAISATAQLQVISAMPFITSPPESQVAAAGTSIQLSVIAEGGRPLAFQWRKNGLPLAGKTEGALALLALTPAESGLYDVVVSNARGAVTSTPPASVNIVSPPVITRQPLPSANDAGSMALFNVVAAGEQLGYQWFKDQTNRLKDNTRIAGSTASALILQDVRAGDRGTYSVTITNLAGAAASRGAELWVTDPAVVKHPLDVLCTIGTAASFEVHASGTAPLSFQWIRNGVSLTDDERVSGSQSRHLMINAARSADAGTYSCVISNSFGSAKSQGATLEVVNHVVIPDPNLSNAVRCALSLPAPDTITVSNMQGLKCVSAQGRQIADLSGLEWARNLEQLTLSDNNIAELGPLRGLYALRVLELENNRITDLSPLQELTNLVCLSVGGNPARNFDALTRLSGLTHFYARKSLIADLSPLDSCFRLQSLVIWESDLEDLGPLAALTNLSALDLRWNRITNVEPLTNCSGLQQLYLSGNPLTNAPHLAALKQLRLLNLDDAFIQNLTPLAGLTSLNYLGISRNPITNYQVLSSCRQLQGLELRGNGLTNIDFVSSLPGLSHLDLAFNQVRDLRSVLSLTNLSIVLDGNTNIDFSMIRGATNIARVWVNGANLTDLSFAANMPQLAAVGADNNRITDLRPLLSARGTLEHLGISGNPVSDYSFLSGLTNLQGLRLEGSTFGNVSLLSTLQRLGFLSLAHNQLTEIASLTALQELRDLYLADNRLTDVGPLTNLPKLVTADLGLNLLTRPGPPEVMDLRTASIVEALRCHRIGHTGCGCEATTNLAEVVLCEGTQARVNPQHGPPDVKVALKLCKTGSDSECRPLWYIPVDATSHVPLEVWYDRDPTGPLTIGVTSSNPALLPLAGIGIEQAGSRVRRRNLSVTPAANATGTGRITVTVTNAVGYTRSAEVEVIVLPRTSLACNSGTQIDRNLEVTLREAADKRDGDLTSADLLDITTLRLSGNVSNFCGWNWLTNVVVLDLGTVSGFNTSLLTNLSSLRNVTVELGSVANIERLGLLSGVTNLVLRNGTVADLSFLTNMTGLKSLLLEGASVSNVQSVYGLRGLMSLSLPDHNITNINFVSGMPELNNLDLSFNRIHDISPLAALTNLESLRIGENYITDLSVLPVLGRLQYANVTRNLVDLWGGSSGATVLYALAQRPQPVAVEYNPQRSPPAFDVRTNWVLDVTAPSSTARFTVVNSVRPDELMVVAKAERPGLTAGMSLTPEAYPYWRLLVSPHPSASGTGRVTLTAIDDAGLRSTTNITLAITPFSPLNGSLLNSRMSWNSSGPAAWFGQNLVTHDGDGAAQSGAIADNEQSTLETSVSGPGQLSFWWKVSSETNYDIVSFYLNNELQASNSGSVDWTQLSFPLKPGANRLVWEYRKDKDTSSEYDAAWIDEVIVNTESLEAVPRATTPLTINLVLHGAVGVWYDLETSTNLISWQVRSSLVLTNDPTTIVENDLSAASRFYRLARGQRPTLEARRDSISGGTEIRIKGRMNRVYEMQMSSDLKTWTAADVLLMTADELTWRDTSPPSNSRFYRARDVTPLR